ALTQPRSPARPTPALGAALPRPPPLNRRSSAHAANGVHSTPRANPSHPGRVLLQAAPPKRDRGLRQPLQLRRRRCRTQTQVFANGLPASGGQVVPLAQGLKHTELLPFGCQLTGLDL